MLEGKTIKITAPGHWKDWFEDGDLVTVLSFYNDEGGYCQCENAEYGMYFEASLGQDRELPKGQILDMTKEEYAMFAMLYPRLAENLTLAE